MCVPGKARIFGSRLEQQVTMARERTRSLVTPVEFLRGFHYAADTNEQLPRSVPEET